MSTTQLFELLYAPDQQLSNPLYTPLRIENKKPDWRELQAYIKIYRESRYSETQLTGLFSPKFELKTKVKLTHFMEFVADNADCDVYFINPFPQIVYYSYNVWMQGECAHPGLIERAQALLNAVNIDWALDAIPRQGANTLAYANFWVGNAKFWQGYLGTVLEPIAQFLEQSPKNPIVQGVMEATQHTDDSPYLPFIIERLFSTYLSLNEDLRIAAFPIDFPRIVDDYCTNDFERILLSHMRDDVDVADKQVQGFSEGVRRKMQMVTALRQQHFFDYYQTRPHPHTGRVVDAALKRN